MLSFFLILFNIFYVSNQVSVAVDGNSNRSTVCVLPEYPDHGTHAIEGTLMNEDRSWPGQSYQNVVLKVTCHPEYGIQDTDVSSKLCDQRKVYCINGEWSVSFPKCIRFCKLPSDPTVNYWCPDGGLKFCGGYYPPGTKCNPTCMNNYIPIDDVILPMECYESGEWSHLPKCKTECGVRFNGADALIANGENALKGQVPWHVGIYQKTTTPYMQICGGSIITNKVIISAAHCFWNSHTSMLYPAANYAVASGKIYRPYNDEMESDAQKSDVKNIKVPPLYQGNNGHYERDIAGVIVASPLVYNSLVLPICFNFQRPFDKMQLSPGQKGTLAGWGLTSAHGPAAPILQVGELPVINDQSCFDALPIHFQSYITVDKICAGYTNGTAVCHGDSGGGLAFPDDYHGKRSYYLRGIVSTAARDDEKACNDKTYTAFTKISSYEDFIKEVIAESDKKSCQGADCDRGNVDGSNERQLATTTERTKIVWGDRFSLQDADRDGGNADGSNERKPVTTTERIPPKLDEGSCEWNGFKGKCVPAKECLTTLDKYSENPPMCRGKDICCTDCQLVNDTSNFVISPLGETFWKDGRKSRDACLQYMQELPYKCHQDGNRAGITRSPDSKRKCHSYQPWHNEGSNPSRSWDRPYEALLGAGKRLETVNWFESGAIITDKFILTAALTKRSPEDESYKYAAVGMRNQASWKSWQIHTVKKIHVHPSYSDAAYNDIALFELEKSITFSTDVLPACLPDPAEEFDVATATFFYFLQKIVNQVKAISTKKCDDLISNEDSALTPNIRRKSQMCYTNPNRNSNICHAYRRHGDPLMVRTQYSSCMNTVIGVSTWAMCKTAVFTNVKHYTPWIESIVWP